ncbi:MAG: hypothetical protein IIW08_00905 [Clostridia bacterium]|nr:hypothetical protein [Clostridia bacterium]MBQ5769714.1 hypothetical protein [Clostridia bacterium]
MKKSRTFFIFLALIIFLLIPHALSEVQWERDMYEHWHLDETGRRIDVGAHRLDDIVCEICLSNVWMFEDGTCDITNYNEYEDIVRNSYYEADGMMLDDYVYIYSYDEDGNKLSSLTYYFGILIEEAEYGLDPFGDSVLKKTIGYNDDGSESVILCDEYGNTLSSTVTAEDGRVLFEESYEYTYGDDGFPIHTVQKSLFDDGSCFIFELDEMGNQLFETQIESDGTVVYAYTHTYEYDERGRMLSERVAENERPVFETFYTYESDDFWGYQSMTIDYFEDGSKTVCEMDEYGEIIKETHYNADGEIIS